MKLKLTVLTVSILCIAACTHSPSVGEKMLNHSDETRKLSKQWTEGEKNIIDSQKLEKKQNQLINSGNKKIAKGKKLTANGENEVKKGNEMGDLSHAKLEKGQRLKQESQSQFIAQYPGTLE
jgi:hypothetical protein